ncbi:T9SS type B sorting domain-containing protein [Arenibacter sp. F26102]|uniref:T9SS type B sorting domain-containing protein n=1 Tax=Arenibacter sp. F26102 TaxID=2926416 RepID=UPI001FF4D200|nr:T9SS type B sorting domain-containing protein [Arenibacter sp. F26102]MCK0146694.1 T9SS type B sorting domain-containing protein [Arenibacter sp. F26102]
MPLTKHPKSLKYNLIAILTLLLFLCTISISYAQLSVPFEPRLPEDNIKVKGDLVYVANNIVSIRSNPNSDYSGNSSNQDVYMDYIDIDGDSSTFSSSSAELNAPSCSAVIYAGLYWGGIYRDTNRDGQHKSVKFKIPGGSYVDIGPSSSSLFEYEQIYDKDGDLDGDGITDPGVVDVDYLSGVNMTSYLNYANVTHLMSGLSDPNGEYTVANIVASTNEKNVSAGWTMVVIYENLNSTSKYISTFDGYAAMGSTYKSVEFDFSGFKTVPSPLPVNAILGASTMDGDRSTGPSMAFRANTTDSWTYLSDGINPSNNVFNSTISNLGSWVDTRTPASRNTLGWDADLLELPNPSNNVLPNDHDSGEIKISTSSEGVILFLTTVSVEIIDPEIIVEKKVEDLAENDITGAGVNLGQSLEYVLRFWNRGNDDAQNLTIRDVLPNNVELESVDLDNALGTTWTTSGTDPTELTFDVPDNLVTEGSNTYEIRIRVKVSNNCNDFVAACSSTIDNIAFSTYEGETSGNTITNDPSVSNVSSCGFLTPGVTNFLLDDLTDCVFKSEIQICGDNAEITAGSGYQTYTWYKDLNENRVIDGSDTVYDDNDPDLDPSTVVVQETGFYLVRKESASCGEAIESMEVTRFGNTQVNPIITYFNTLNGDSDPTNDIQGEIVQCSNDGSELPKIFLCGVNDTQELILNITDAASIAWEKLDETSCSITNSDCATNQIACTWNQVASGNSYTANEEGRFRLVLTYSGGCSSRFYFDVYKNNLDFESDSQDIYCSTDGFIRISGVGSGYGYQLVDTTTETVLVPYSAGNGPNFTISTVGTYRVEFTQLDGSGIPLEDTCVFSTEDIGISRKELTLNLTTKAVNCTDKGSVRIQVGQGRANYHYELYTDDGSGNPGTLIDNEPAQTTSDYTFSGLNAGDYVVVVKTDDNCEVAKTVTVEEIPDPEVTAVTTKQITCTDGTITLSASEGYPDPSYLYAIWEKDGSTSYTDISDIPTTEFQRDTIAPGVFNFPSGEEGSYRFVVVDGNNCWSISNVVTIEDLGSLTVLAPTIDSEVKCEGSGTGKVTMNVSGGQTPYTFTIDDWATQQSDPTFVNLTSGTYTIKVQSADGCEEEVIFTLNDPETFKANAGVSSTGTCDVNEYSEVRFTNVEGGTQPYQFSFDGGSTFITDDPMDPSVRTSQLPSGSHILIAKDARGCEISLPITIDPVPPIPVFDANLDYDCDGNGNISITTNQTIYNYVYTIDTTPNISVTDGEFTGIAPGSYSVTAEYTENNPPNPSVLLHEDFGSGPTVDSDYVYGYTYEDQVGSNTYINDFEYSVTSSIVSPYGSWLIPEDNTTGGTDTSGRYLVINVGSPSPGQVIYKKPIQDITPNQDMRVSFAAINLLKSGSQLDPNLFVQMRIPGTETAVGEVQTSDIPKNKIWNVYEFPMNPGTYTELDFVIISKKFGNSGNDVAIDDIKVEQIPQSCPRTMEIPVVIEAGESFEANVVGYTDISCKGANDGSISFEVENFDPSAGFEYSNDGGSNWIASTTSPVTTATVLTAGTQSILVRKADDNGCTTSLDQLISEPDPILVSGSIVKELSCGDPTGTIKATANGGTPTYEYALEDDLGNTVVAFPNPNGDTFTGLTIGNYVIIVRDINGCTQKSAAVVLEGPEALTYSVAATSCYDGGNNATITLTANTGNGGYLFQIGGSGNPWQAPSPSTGNTFTFSGLSNQTYTVNVKDSYGCDGGEEIVTIDAQLVVNITTTDVSTCADGSIEVTASGGNGTLVYAFVSNGSTPAAGDFSTTNIFPVAAGDEGDYDVYVRDNSAGIPYCEYMETFTINPATPLTMTATPTAPQCHDGNGNISINITTGISPYTVQIVDIDNGGASNQTDTNVLATSKTYYNLLPGDYTINITDATGCTITDNQTINNPDELTATITGITPSNCTGDVNDFGFRFSGYPTTLGTIEFSDDGGTTWISDNSVPGTSDELTGYNSGETVYPSMRTVDGFGNNLCQTDFPPFIIPYPLDDLDITIDAVVVNCSELQVTVQGSEGVAPYEYAYSDDPSNFDPLTATWVLGGNEDNLGNPVPTNEGMHRWEDLIPGRTYVFYVRDTNGCVRQSNVNVNDLITEPIGITSTIVPSCNGSNNGSITYEIIENVVSPGSEMEWSFYDISSGTPMVVEQSIGNTSFTSGQTLEFELLGAGNYYLEITKKNGASSGCVSASENELLEELDPLNGTLNILQDISCNNPGLIEVQNPIGGGGLYTYTITGPSSFTMITDTSDNPIEIPSNSPSGNYAVIMEDQYGCPMDLGSIHLDLSPNPTIDNIIYDNCSTQATVTISASSLAAANIFYSIDGGNTYLDNGGIFKGIVAGNYTVGIIDSNGCSTTQSITVHPSLQAKAQLTKLLDCSSSVDATIEIEALQGSGTYQYSVENLTTASTEVAKTSMGGDYIEYHPTVAGTYEIKVYVDATGDHAACERTFTVEVPESIEPVFEASPTHVSCNGANDGSIALTQTDTGISPLSYELFDSAWNPIPSGDYTYVAASRTFEGLAPGDYLVRATGTNGCTSDSTTITIDEPTPIIVTIPATDIEQFGCAVGNNPDNASIEVSSASLTGGTGNYVRYQFINPSSTEVQDGSNNKLIVTDHSGGIYTVNVYDNTGCMGTTTVTISPFDELQDANIVIDDAISCANSGETISITANGSLTNSSTTGHDYSFEYLATGDTNNTGTFNGLQVGMHAFSVTNTVTGCSITVTHTVEEIEDFDINVIEDSPIVCAGDYSQNHIEITSGYTGNFNWTAYDANGTLSDSSDDTHVVNGSGNATLSGNIDLPKGSYRIIVEQTDFPYCTEETMVTIGGADTPLDANITEIGNASCSNDQGRLSVEPTGGIAPYTISIPSLGLTQSAVYSYVFTNLSDGNYTITITDAAGCTNSTLSGSIQTIDPLVADIDPATQTLDCIGDADGSIYATLSSGGVGTVLYSLNTLENGTVVATSTTQTSATFSGLNSGTYSINITDDAGCSYTTSEVLVNDPEPVVGSLVMSRSLTCDVEAQLTLSVTGGTPFTGNVYQWSTSETGPFTNMSGGNTQVLDVAPNSTPYQYYVQDANGCTPVVSNAITINDITPLTAAVDLNAAFINCNGDSTASISAKASGGLGAYIYGLYYDSDMTLSAAPTNTEGYFESLPQGTYYVGITSRDCEWISTSIVISEPDPLVITTEITDVSCMGADDGSIVLSVTGGTEDYQYAISPNLNKFDDESTFTDLAAGDYTIIAQDANGCFEILEITIQEPEELSLTLTTEDEICFGSEDGLVTIDIQGGTAPYSTSINSNADSDFAEGIMSYGDLASGTYVIFIKDANGCTANSVFTIEPGYNLAGSVEVVYECNGIIPTNYLSIQFEDQTVVPDVLYAIDSTDPNDMVMDPDFANLTPGDHTLYVAHANGCIRTFDVVVEDFEPLTLQLTNENINEIKAEALGGNPDYTYQINDEPVTEDNTFFIKRTDTYSITVFDETGCSVTHEIFVEFIDIEISNFFTPNGDGLNDTWKPKNIEIFPNITISIFDRYGRKIYSMLQNTAPWEGAYQDSNLPVGDYWYIIKLNGDQDSREFVGNFTLYR